MIQSEMFEAVINSIKSVVSENANKGNKLLGVSFSSAMHGIMAVNENGDKLTDCIIWADTRSTEYSERIKSSKIGHEIYMKTGTPIHPMSPLCKLAWMKDNMKKYLKIHTNLFLLKNMFSINCSGNTLWIIQLHLLQVCLIFMNLNGIKIH